jgi:hypothetical protein
MGKLVSHVRCWQQWREAEARDVLEELAASGESMAAFARRRGVSTRRLAYWRKRLLTGAATEFVAVALPETSGAFIEIAAAGVVVRVREELDVKRVAELAVAIGRRTGDAC